MRAWAEGEHVYVTGAMGGQKQRAVVVGPDPDNAGRFLVTYLTETFGRTGVQSIHHGRLREAVPPLPPSRHDDGAPSWCAS